VVGAVLVMHDITKEKEVDRLKSEFISITSHELRTPLASIKQGIYLVLSETVGKINEQQKKFLEIGKRNVDRLSNLINDLLDLSKIESGKMVLERKSGSINKLLEDIASNFEPAAAQKQIGMEKQLQPDLTDSDFDPDKISQVIANLLNNAIKFTPEGGKITVSSSYYGSDPNYILVGVEDTGVGILKEDMDKLFKKFQQLDMRLTRKAGGTGLGLAVCKQIVELHGGRVWAESAGRDKGSKFSFILPKEGKVMEKAAQKKIMVIDDEKDLCDTAKGILEGKNYAVTTALSGQEGLDKIKESKPDLIVLDLMMPEMDGFAVAEKLKKNPETSQIPIIVLTALDQEESAKRVLSLGAKGYLVKPFEPEALLFTLQEFLK
jgi:CheY-like chemotaxis protein/nitrogen-specific signal transduction histidine kinase